MPPVVGAVSKHKLMIVTHKPQRGSHGLVRQRPVSVQIIQIVGAILQKDTDGFALRLADQRGVIMAAANVCETANRRKHLPELIGPLPRDGERANATRTRAAN